MRDLYVWSVILGLTGVTVLTRSFFLVLGDRIPLPERVQHAMRYAPACALAGVITMLVARSMMLTIVVGMAVFTLLRFL